MGLFKKLFGGGAAEKPHFAIVETSISTDSTKYQVRVRRQGQEMYAEDLFKAADNPKDLIFDRFYLLNENPPQLHFAPTMELAADWFKGLKLPKDGYLNIFWGEEVTFQCSTCQKETRQPLNITKMEKLTVNTDLTMHQEIIGWRVVEVGCDLMGPGIPSKILDISKTKPIIKWSNPKDKFVCEGCAQQLKQEDLEGFVIFR